MMRETTGSPQIQLEIEPDVIADDPPGEA